MECGILLYLSFKFRSTIFAGHSKTQNVMKKLTLIALLLSFTFAKAQNFEGIISWKFTMVITDPKAKAEMEAAQKKMNDPETQAQMKAMQEQMNDPQMKAMMEANPQMKKQMEAAMKMAQGGGDINSMMPKGMVTKVKNQNAITVMDGGFMGNMEMLYLKDKNTTYSIDREAKTYSVMPQNKGDGSSEKKIDVKVTKTSETAKILNYPCTKYIVEVTSDGNTLTQYFWTTTAIKDFDLKSLSQQRIGGNSNAMLFYDKLEGVPLKVEMPSPKGSMLMEMTEYKKQSLSSADFAIPAGFKEVPSKY